MQTFRGQSGMHTRKPTCLMPLMPDQDKPTLTHTHYGKPHWTDHPTENGGRCSGSQRAHWLSDQNKLPIRADRGYAK